MEPHTIPAPPTPRLVHTYDDNGRGGWYAGTIEWPGAPVLVFVPGLAQPACSFWEKSEVYGLNEMYARAITSGFRTAFVGFSAAKEKPMDMWRNGRILAWQLADICAFYQTDNVILVAHSKGGIDAQTAAVYYGAADRIQKLYTLSSPHWGSELADLAYSSIGFSLGERMGVHSDGCYVMQTGYMRAYRQKTDAVGRAIPIYTFAGCGSGPMFSRVWAGAQILSCWGKSDGVVTVKSAQNPTGQHLATLDFDHIQMQSGQYIWPHILDALHFPQGLAQPVSAEMHEEIGAETAEREVSDGLLLRGGDLQNGVKETFAVDSGVQQLEACVMAVCSAALADQFALTAPDGTMVTLQKTHAESGAYVLRATVKKAAPGFWKLSSPMGNGAYVLSVRFQTGGAVVRSGTKSAGRRVVQNVKSALRIFQTFPDHCQMVYEGKAGTDGEQPLTLDDGIYSVEHVLQGELDDGSPYERNVVRQVSFRRKR